MPSSEGEKDEQKNWKQKIERYRDYLIYFIIQKAKQKFGSPIKKIIKQKNNVISKSKYYSEIYRFKIG